MAQKHYTITVLVKDDGDPRKIEQAIAAAVERVVQVVEDVHLEEDHQQTNFEP